jgi:hypothetical protein
LKAPDLPGLFLGRHWNLSNAFTHGQMNLCDGAILGIEPLLHVNRYFQAVGMAIIAWAYVDRRTTSQLIASVLYSIVLIAFVVISWFSPPG